MKKVILLAGIVMLSFAANAQVLAFGLKGGANFPNLKLKSNATISNINTDLGSGFHAGFMARIHLAIFYIQPELLYTRTSTAYSFSTSSTVDETGKYIMQRLDVPVMAGLKMGPFAIFAGPVASIALASPNEIFDNSYKTATFGYQAGVGLKIGQLLIEGKYEGPFGDQADGAVIGGDTYKLDARQSMWMLSFGYFFDKE